MPDMVCVKHGGVSYCWNFETEQVEVFTREPVAEKDCPAEVLYDLMKLVSNRLTKSGTDRKEI